MNDHDAMTAINAALNEYFTLGLTAVEALHKIAQISGRNATEHEAAK